MNEEAAGAEGGPSAQEAEAAAEIARLTERIRVLEAGYVDRWAELVGETHSEIIAHRQMLVDMRATLSWRITKPIRAVRGRGQRDA